MTFFIVPSFTFVSEINGKSHSLLLAYSKTRGSLVNIAITAFTALAALILIMFLLTFVNIYVAAVARAALLAFVSILYFKMYDFFYNFPHNKKDRTSTDLKRDEHGKFISAKIAEENKTTPKDDAENGEESGEISSDELKNSHEETGKADVVKEKTQKKVAKKSATKIQ